jgi:hypothetical protein
MCKLLLAKLGWRFCLWLAASCLVPADENAGVAEEGVEEVVAPPMVVPIAPDARFLVVECGADGDSVALLFANEAGLPIAVAKVALARALMPLPEILPAPRPLNLDAQRLRTDTRLGEMQRRYRASLEGGQFDEAAELAAELMTNEDRSLMPADLVEPAAGAAFGSRHHQVGYGPSAEPAGHERSTLALRQPVDWQSIARRPISFDFHNANLVEVAGFFHHVTGMPVRLDLPVDRLRPGVGGVYARCNGKPTGEALQIVLASCGLGFVVEETGIRITEPQNGTGLIIPSSAAGRGRAGSTPDPSREQ